jgi:hypothetical protein
MSVGAACASESVGPAQQVRSSQWSYGRRVRERTSFPQHPWPKWWPAARIHNVCGVVGINTQ